MPALHKGDCMMSPPGVALVLAYFALTGPAWADAPYEGLWSKSLRTCRTDTDGVERLEINRQGLFWYEERCRGRVRAVGRRRWHAELSCEGEGSKRRMITRLTLPSSDTLVLENAPVSPVDSHRYVRCAPKSR